MPDNANGHDSASVPRTATLLGMRIGLSRIAIAYVASTAVLGASVLVAPEWRALAWGLAGLLSVLAIVVGVRTNAPRLRTPWWLLAGAIVAMATGDILNAQQALALGLVNQVTPLAELDDTVDRLAQRLVAAPSMALARIKAGLNYAAHSDLAGALDFEAINQDACFNSPDFLEGVTAFLEKRKAVFGKAAGGQS